MANFLWPIFMISFGFTDSCRFFGKDYDPNEHTFLCTNNETVAEKLVSDLLAAARSKDDFDHLSEELLKDLMVIYRDAVTEIFQQKTCEDNYCHPRLLPDQVSIGRDRKQLRMEISSLELVQNLFFDYEINDLAVTPSKSGKYVVVAFVTGTPVALLEYTSENLLQAKKFTSYPGSCLVASSAYSSWKPPVIALTSCHPEDISKQHNKHKTNYVYVFNTLSRGVEMTQAVEINLGTVSGLQLTWQRATPRLSVFGEGSALHHTWNDYKFTLSTTTNLPEAFDISTFQYKDATYIILSKFTHKQHPEGVYIYQSLRSQPDKYTLYQRLTICAPKDTEHFKFSNMHFLAVTCFKDNHAYIYWWSENQFLLWQSIHTPNAESWTAIQLINREIILALVEYQDYPSVRFFHVEDEYFVPSEIEINLKYHLPGRRIVMTSFNLNSETILLVSGKLSTALLPEIDDQQPTFGLRQASTRLDSLLVYKLHVRPRVQSKLSHQVEDVQPCLSQIGEKLDQERILINELDIPRTDWMVTNETQIITGGKVLVPGLYAKDITVDKLFLGPTVHLHAEENFHCEECELQERAIEEELDKLLEETKDLVQKGQPQTITGKKIIANNLIVEQRFHSTNIITGTVCKINFNHLNETMLRKTGDQVFHNDVVIEGDITTVNIDFVGLVNGIKLENIATLSGPRHFTAPQIFDHLTVSSVELTGTLNEIHPHEIVIHDRPQEISGSKVLKGNLIIDGRLTIEDRFYGVDVRDLAKNILTTNTQQEIKVDVIFEDVEFVHRVVAGSVLGADLNYFYQNHLNTDQPQTIYGSAIFVSDVVVTENVDIAFVNGMDLHRDFLTTNTFQLIRDKITIVGNVTVHGNVNTNSNLHGLDFANDIVTRSGLQEITGHKIFMRPVEVGNIELPGGLVNGMDVSQVGYPVAASTRHVSIDELNVEMINGKSVRDLLNVLRKRGRQYVTGNFVFNDVTLNNIHVHGLVSGYRLDHDFMTRETDQVIQEELIFDRYVKVLGSMSFNDRITINNVDLSVVKMNAVTVDGDQDINGRKIFMQEVHVKENIVVQPGVKFNGVDLSEHLFVTNKNQIIQHHFDVEEIVIHDDVVFHGFINTTTINDVHVSKFFDNVVYLEGDYKIGGVKRFTSDVEIINQLNVNLINGFDLGAIQKRIVRLSTEQIITGQIIHKGTLNLEAATHVELINGVDFAREISRWARVENGHVRDTIEFTKCVEFEEDVNVITINNLDMETTMKNILSKSRPQNLTLAREIEENVFIHNLITPRINNIPLDDVRLTRKKNIITNPVVFLNSVDVTVDLSINTLNGIRLQELFENSIMKERNAVVTGTKTFTTINAKSLVVNGLFNGLDFSLLPQRLVSKDKPQVITANVHFEHDIVIHDFQTSGLVNRVDLERMIRFGFTKSSQQTITAPMIFSTDGPQRHSVVVEDTVEITGDLVNVDLIDGVDIALIAEEAVLQYEKQDITAPIIFQTDVHVKNIHVTKTLNNLRIPDDIALTKGDQKISGNVTFSRVTFTKLDVINNVNNVNITRLLTRRITTTTEQIISRPVEFEEEVIITGDLIVRETINGLRCSDIVTTDTDQVIEGEKTFVDIEALQGVETDYVNDVHWLVLFNQIQQIVERKWIHYGEVIFDKVILIGKLSNDDEAKVKANELKTTAINLRDKTRNYVMEYENWRLTSCQCLGKMASQVSKLAHNLEYFDFLQNLEHAIDIAIVPYREEFYILLLQKPDDSLRKNCNNLLTYACTNLPATCDLVENLPIPIQNTQIIDFFPGTSASFLTFQNPHYSKCSQSSGTFVHILGKNLSLTNKIDNTVVDAISVLPGHSMSLMAIARMGRIDIQRISCDNFTCVLYDDPVANYLHGERVMTLKWFHMHGVLHLFVLAASNSVSVHKGVLSTIFRWHDDRKLVKSHELSTISPSDAVIFEINDDVYLAIGSFDHFNDLNSNRLRIYKINDKIKIIQEIAISTKALSVFKHFGETYLMVSHVDRDVFIYRWRGFFGFQFWSRIEIKHPGRLRPFVLRDIFYIAMAGNGDDDSESLIVIGKQTDFYYSPNRVQRP